MITDYHDKEAGHIEQIKKLQHQLKVKDKRIAVLEKEVAVLVRRALKSESALKPVRDSLNSMTAERGKILRKAKRAGIKL